MRTANPGLSHRATAGPAVRDTSASSAPSRPTSRAHPAAPPPPSSPPAASPRCASAHGPQAPLSTPRRAARARTCPSLASAVPAPVSRLLLLGPEELRQDCLRLLPLARFPRHLFPPRARQFIKFRLPVIVRISPLRLDVPILFEFQQRRIQRPVVHAQQISADLLDAPCDSVAMQLTHRLQRLQHHQRQRSLPDIRFLAHPPSYGITIGTLPNSL